MTSIYFFFDVGGGGKGGNESLTSRHKICNSILKEHQNNFEEKMFAENSNVIGGKFLDLNLNFLTC